MLPGGFKGLIISIHGTRRSSLHILWFMHLKKILLFLPDSWEYSRWTCLHCAHFKLQEGQNIILESPASVTCPKCNRRGTLHHSYFVYWATHRYLLEDYQLLFWVWSHVHSIWGIKDWCFPNLQTWYQSAPLIVVVWSVGMWVPPRCGMGWLWFQSHCESWHGIQFNTVQFNLDFDCTLVSR